MKSLIPGSFDPVTLGHLQLIKRAAALSEKVYAVIMDNPQKAGKYMFSESQRLEMLKCAVRDLPNVCCDIWHGLAVDYMKEHGIEVFIKGLRSGADYEYEYNMAMTNKSLYDGAETLFLCSDKNLRDVSSTQVRERAERQESLAGLVPAEIEKMIKEYRNIK